MSSKSNQPHTVVHLLSSAEVHGIAQVRIVSALGRDLDPIRYRLVAWFLAAPGPLENVLGEAGVATRVLPFQGGTDPGGALRFARALANERPALIHLHVGGRSRMWLCRWASSAKLVVHFHGTHSEEGKPEPLWRLSRGADAVLATSSAVADVTGRDATVVYPGINLRADGAKIPRPGKPTIGTAARLEPIKRIDDLLSAAALLQGRHPGLRIEIAGSGSSEPGLKGRAWTLGIADSVRFLGWRQDIEAIHRRWSAFAIPSRYEGFGLAALEAMASGLPVVGSDTGGIPELVDEGKTGFLFPAGDVDALADRLDLLLSDEPLRRRMGVAAQERACRRFGMVQMTRRIAEVYDRLLSE